MDVQELQESKTVLLQTSLRFTGVPGEVCREVFGPTDSSGPRHHSMQEVGE